MSLRDKAAIVGVGCSQFGENWTMDAEDMIVDAVFEAYEDAGIGEPDRQIDAIYCGSLYSPILFLSPDLLCIVVFLGNTALITACSPGSSVIATQSPTAG